MDRPPEYMLRQDRQAGTTVSWQDYMATRMREEWMATTCAVGETNFADQYVSLQIPRDLSV